MRFTYKRCGLVFEARKAFRFPWSGTGNAFRGALGLGLRAVAPSVYDSAFVPVGGGPSGYKNRPRPFVLRVSRLVGRAATPGQRFSLGLHTFSDSAAPWEDFARAFEREAPFSGSCRLVGVKNPECVETDLVGIGSAVNRVSVRFISPMELKDEGGLADNPEFPILFSRTCERVSALARFYAEPLTADAARLVELAKTVRVISQALVREKSQRTSTRTGQTHSLGGFRGEATYSGELAELLPWLIAGEGTGVGRQTVWGKGEIEVRITCV